MKGELKMKPKIIKIMCAEGAARPPKRELEKWAKLLSWEIETSMRPLPFDNIGAPPLVAVKQGVWELTPGYPLPPLVRGYFRGLHEPHSRENWVLVNHETQTIWMSVAPMELESQSHHVLAAKGRVLVGGLGLGAILWALLEKPEVEHITVIERDPQVINIMREVWRRDPRWKKHLVPSGAPYGPRFYVWPGDIFEVSKDPEFSSIDIDSPSATEFDFGLIDIWPGVGDSALRADMQRLRAAWPGVAQWAGWGQEMDYVSWRIESKLSSHEVREEHWAQYSAAIGVPLIGRNWRWMSALGMQAAIVQALSHIDQDDEGRKS
jgi:hypothetical protein